MMSKPVESRKTYVFVFAALLALLATSMLAASLELGALNATVALTIAILKAFLIAFYFMHLRYSTPLTWVIALGGAFWLGILLVLTMSDYLTRGWLPIPGK